MTTLEGRSGIIDTNLSATETLEMNKRKLPQPKNQRQSIKSEDQNARAIRKTKQSAKAIKKKTKRSNQMEAQMKTSNKLIGPRKG